MDWDRKKGLKGKVSQNPKNDEDEDLLASQEINNKSPSKYQTNQSIKSIGQKSLAKTNQSMMRSNASIKSVATTVNQERLAYVKKCWKLRGFALIEALFDPLYKTVREALRCFAVNCCLEKVNMFKN